MLTLIFIHYHKLILILILILINLYVRSNVRKDKHKKNPGQLAGVFSKGLA